VEEDAKRGAPPTTEDDQDAEVDHPYQLKVPRPDEDFEIPWGKNIQVKLDGHIRIGALNVRHFPFENGSNETKYDALKNHLITSEFDILGLSEISKNWSNITEERQLHTIMGRWWKNCSTNCSWLRDHHHR